VQRARIGGSGAHGVDPAWVVVGRRVDDGKRCAHHRYSDIGWVGDLKRRAGLVASNQLDDVDADLVESHHDWPVRLGDIGDVTRHDEGILEKRCVVDVGDHELQGVGNCDVATCADDAIFVGERQGKPDAARSQHVFRKALDQVDVGEIESGPIATATASGQQRRGENQPGTCACTAYEKLTAREWGHVSHYMEL